MCAALSLDELGNAVTNDSPGGAAPVRSPRSSVPVDTPRVHELLQFLDRSGVHAATLLAEGEKLSTKVRGHGQASWMHARCLARDSSCLAGAVEQQRRVGLLAQTD